jgi:hypothetical protein
LAARLEQSVARLHYADGMMGKGMMRKGVMRKGVGAGRQKGLPRRPGASAGFFGALGVTARIA